jgi:malate dehydrogenase (oxaloacetate-decarboxylating)
MSKNYAKLSLKAHKKTGGKISITSKFKLKNKDDLSIAYTPGVGAVSLYVSENQKKNPNTAKEYTTKKNMVAVVSDGSAVLGLGNIGPYGAIPVMEGKAVLMKHFASVNPLSAR